MNLSHKGLIGSGCLFKIMHPYYFKGTLLYIQRMLPSPEVQAWAIYDLGSAPVGRTGLDFLS